MHSEVLPLRRASRELVRELGFLEGRHDASGLSHSEVHALIELDERGALAQGVLAERLRLDKSTTSRLVADLAERGFVQTRPSAHDGRTRDVSLTARGRTRVAAIHRDANARVDRALALLRDEDRAAALHGLEVYARALERARKRAACTIRPMRASDRAGVARLIRTVMPEYGAKGPGFAILDPEVDDMYGAYRAKRSAYFVVIRHEPTSTTAAKGDVVVGGGGFAPLQHGDEGTCELRKMYFKKEARGLGLGQELLARCLDGAKRAGFSRMYLETLSTMHEARALYDRNGFIALDAPLGDTGHFGCNAYYARAL